MSIRLLGALPLAAYSSQIKTPIASTTKASTPAPSTATKTSSKVASSSPTPTSKSTNTSTNPTASTTKSAGSANPSNATAAKSAGSANSSTAAGKSIVVANAGTTAAKSSAPVPDATVKNVIAAALNTAAVITTGVQNKALTSAVATAIVSKTSPGVIYNSSGKLLSTTNVIGGILNVSVKATPSGTSITTEKSSPVTQKETTPPNNPLAANEQILLAKRMYEQSHQLGDAKGIELAKEIAEDARKNGGTISSNVTLQEAKTMVANAKILQAKLDYEAAAKDGNIAGLRAAEEAAKQARLDGGTISSKVNLDQAKTVVANQQIVQAKLDYTAAQEKGDVAKMKAAREAADLARNNGGTISHHVNLQQAKSILEYSIWNGMEPDSPMDFISAEDEAVLLNLARKNEATFGVKAQVAKLDELIAIMEEIIENTNESIATRKRTIAIVAEMIEDNKELIEKYKELGRMIDSLKEESTNTLTSVNEFITGMEKKLESGKLSGSQGLKLAEGFSAVCEVQAMLQEADEQRGTILGQALNGLFTGIWTSLDETIDYVFYAMDDPKAAGNQALQGLDETAKAIWNKVSDPNATYQDAKQSVQEYMELTDEEKAYSLGYLLSQFSPSRRTDFLTPNKNKDDGANGVGGSNENGIGRNDGSNANSSGAVEGTGNLNLPKMKIDDNQFGRKVGKHAEDYGLDPDNPDSRQWVRNHIEDIRSNPEEIRSGTWNGLGDGPPNARGRGPAVFYRQGNDVIVTDTQGNFVTILKDGINNTSFKSGEVLK